MTVIALPLRLASRRKSVAPKKEGVPRSGGVPNKVEGSKEGFSRWWREDQKRCKKYGSEREEEEGSNGREGVRKGELRVSKDERRSSKKEEREWGCEGRRRRWEEVAKERKGGLRRRGKGGL